MHKNTYLNSPKVLNKFYQTNKRNDLFFAGQITGVEGYLESASSGMVASINMARFLRGQELFDFTNITSIGSLPNYISSYNPNFEPMNVNHGIFAPLDERKKKTDKKKAYAERSLEFIDMVKDEVNE